MDEAVLVVADAPLHLRKLAAFIEPFVETARAAGKVRPGLDVKRASDWIARLAFSFTMRPGDPAMNDPQEIRRLFKDFLTVGFLRTGRK